MTVPGETVRAGAPRTCPDCLKSIDGPKVMQSNAGFYIGYECDCGPYSRESSYSRTRKDAQEMLGSGEINFRK